MKVSTISEIVDGIKSILHAENVQHFHVIGQSLGGIIAQEIIRKFPNMMEKAILSHITTKSDSINRKSLELTRKNIVSAIKLVKLLPMPLIKIIFKNKILGHLASMKKEDRNFWFPYFCELIASKTKENEISSYCCMLDFADNYNYSPSDFSHMKGKVLILESETDSAFHLEQKRAVKELFPEAFAHTFKDSGHLTIITAQEDFMMIMKEFLEE